MISPPPPAAVVSAWPEPVWAGNRARVSRQWISEFESGKPSAEFGLVLRLLDALGLRLSVDELAAGVGGDQPPRRETVDLDALLEDYRER